MTRTTFFWLFFGLALIIDYTIRKDYLGERIKYYYLKLIKYDLIINFTLFSIIFICLTLFDYFYK